MGDCLREHCLKEGLRECLGEHLEERIGEQLREHLGEQLKECLRERLKARSGLEKQFILILVQFLEIFF